MTYMTVSEKTEDKLVLTRSPGLYAVAVAAGIFAVLLWLTKQPPDIDSNWWTPVAAIICFFASLTTIDNWEVSEFNKTQSTVRLTKQSLFQKLLKQEPSSAIIPMQSIESVEIEETVLKYVKQKVRVVTLTSAEGHVYYITGSGTTDQRRYHEEICDEIKGFLTLREFKEDENFLLHAK